MKHNCRWVIKPYANGEQAVYCEKPVRYHIEKDDDGNPVRVYDTFCAEHKPLADAIDKERESD